MLFPQLSNIIVHRSSSLQRIFMYVGERFGKWKVLKVFRKKMRDFFLLECECGRQSERSKYHVENGYTQSCLNCAPKKHGLYGTLTNKTWSAARNRCNNPNNKDYIHYGGRGIKMCERWDIFENFLADMGEKPKGLTLDRINNNGNYEPGNCRWATYSQQNKNQRKRFSSGIKKESEG